MKGHRASMKGNFRKCDQLETNHRFIIEWEILHLPHSIASSSHFTKCNPRLSPKPRCLQGNNVENPPILRKQSIKGSLQFCQTRSLAYHQNWTLSNQIVNRIPNTKGWVKQVAVSNLHIVNKISSYQILKPKTQTPTVIVIYSEASSELLKIVTKTSPKWL